ncbi:MULTISPECIES: LysR substrate-binding domain-containing protein [Alphaproteobacteria]|uniref:LysR family transcriptional regulator n=2 Tax=Alphaproteobacteria TaxID=28211 RepID=A0A512HF07_9HYPH|nr:MULTISPECIES: LysR substrate-binding domain-containing protein [Alphaproteobacteria]GEO84042.1 LysR family transcriptional regulator [Ciceribacter naphthalenivorans]GLR21080.1 LysR family transcriptional regulator [Ciceribacter naphthalenivorans]GLT03936.1 LysR family transcriptional regulator [Sphingomonas psychrolutea]
MKLSKQFPLNALRVFEAVGRLGSFTKAGEELGMTQTAVSYQIKLLEENIGELLFLRRPRQIALTPIGERMLPKVTEAFATLREVIDTARQNADEILEIHSTPTFASHWLARHLGAFQLAHQNIAVRLLRGSRLTDFSRETADLAIRISQAPWPGLTCHPILRLSYSPMLSPKLAESIGGVKKPVDLLKLPWITDDDGRWTRWFTQAGLDAADHTARTFDAGGALDLEAGAAMAGHGVAMLSPFYLQDELASGRLIQPFELSWLDDSTYWLVYPENRRNLPKVRKFREWLEATLAPERDAIALAAR